MYHDVYATKGRLRSCWHCLGLCDAVVATATAAAVVAAAAENDSNEPMTPVLVLPSADELQELRHFLDEGPDLDAITLLIRRLEAEDKLGAAADLLVQVGAAADVLVEVGACT